jgi:DNA-binding NtrC family response regulator
MTPKKPDSKFLKYLMDHNWPGNIRELENAIQRTIILSNSDTLTSKNLPDEIKNAPPKKAKKSNFNEQVDEFKKQLIIEALDKHDWLQKNAAKSLGLKPTTLSELMKRMNIQN